MDEIPDIQPLGEKAKPVPKKVAPVITTAGAPCFLSFRRGQDYYISAGRKVGDFFLGFGSPILYLLFSFFPVLRYYFAGLIGFGPFSLLTLLVPAGIFLFLLFAYLRSDRPVLLLLPLVIFGLVLLDILVSYLGVWFIQRYFSTLFLLLILAATILIVVAGFLRGRRWLSIGILSGFVLLVLLIGAFVFSRGIYFG